MYGLPSKPNKFGGCNEHLMFHSRWYIVLAVGQSFKNNKR
jgi:hypothetical protein